MKQKQQESFRIDFPSVAAGVFYGLSMFGAGFLIGAIRVLYLEPWMGELYSFLLELPIMLPICWYLSWQSLMCWYLLNIVFAWAEKGRRYTNVDTMGVTAFLTLVLLEIALSMTLFHKTFYETQEDFATRIGTAGLVAQLVASSFPILQEELHERWMQ